MKERYMATQLRTLQNRLQFAPDVGEYGDSAMGLDSGMVGTRETGNVRAVQKKESKLLSKKHKSSSSSSSSSHVSGLSSSLAFTPVQGIELVNPNAAAERVKQANEKWFNSYSGFKSAVPK